MEWARMLAYIAGTVDQELPLRNDYFAAENRILRAQFNGRLLLSQAEGKGNVLLFPSSQEPMSCQDQPVRCRERLGGLLKQYYRQAA